MRVADRFTLDCGFCVFKCAHKFHSFAPAQLGRPHDAERLLAAKVVRNDEEMRRFLSNYANWVLLIKQHRNLSVEALAAADGPRALAGTMYGYEYAKALRLAWRTDRAELPGRFG